jgi:hypothetical protein
MLSRLSASSSLLQSSRYALTRASRPTRSGLHFSSFQAATASEAQAESNAGFWLLGAAAVAVPILTATTIVQCEQHQQQQQEQDIDIDIDSSAENEETMEQILILAQQQPPNNSNKAKAKPKAEINNNDTDTDKPDPYENLPERDKETDCLLCRTHRQGPCRNVWRKFEYCVKDHSKDNTSKKGGTDAATVCDKYVAPFEECWKRHVNLYTLIALDVHQPVVHDLELEYRPADRRLWDTKSQPVMDWTAWLDFIRQKGSLAKALENMTTWPSLDRQVPLWQRFQILETGDPTVIQVSSAVPTTMEKDGLFLQVQVVYALDQDDMLIGYSEYNGDYETQQAAKEKRAVSATIELAISVMPAMTENVRVFALYVENPAKAGPKQKAFLYESPKVSPNAVAKTV